MGKYYQKGYAKPTDITENTFAFILGHLYAEATNQGKILYEELLSDGHISRWAFIDFCSAFNALFNGTANLIENGANTELLGDIREKFMDMAQHGIPSNPNMPKCEGCIEFYTTFLQYLKVLQKSELMDLIKEANVFNDSGG